MPCFTSPAFQTFSQLDPADQKIILHGAELKIKLQDFSSFSYFSVSKKMLGVVIRVEIELFDDHQALVSDIDTSIRH